MPAGNTTANGTLVSKYPSKQKHSNANARIHMSGTFDGASIKVYFQSDGDPAIGPNSDGWLLFSGGTYTSADDDIINLPNSVPLRVIVSGVGGSTDIDWSLD